jgi:phage-related protein
VLKETFNNLAGSAVGAVVPALTSVLKGFVDNLPAIQNFAAGIANRAQPVLAAVVGVIRDYALPILNQLRTIFTTAVEKIVGVLEANKPALTQIWTNVRTLIASVTNVLEATLIPILRLALEKVLPAAIAVALPVLAKLTEGFRIIAAIVNAGADAVDGVKGALAGVASFVTGAWGKVKSALTGPLEAAQGPFDTFLGIVRAIAGALRDIADAASSALGWLGKVSGAAGAVKGVLGHLPHFAEGVTGFAGGLALVGERGPELVRLPAGSDVIPNHKLGPALASVAAKSGVAQAAAGLFAGATFIVRDELDAHAIGAAVASRLASLAPA